MTTALAVIDHAPTHERSLDELAAIANAEHASVIQALLNAVHHGIFCGEALAEAKQRLPKRPGSWVEWVDKNLTMSTVSADGFIRLATYQELLPAEAFEPYRDSAGRMRKPSVNRAMLYLNALPSLRPHYRPKISTELKREIRKLRSAGTEYKVIAEMLSVSISTAYYVCNMEAQRKADAHRTARKREVRRGRAALRMQETRDEHNKLAKVAGGAVADAYSLVVRACQRTQKAQETARTPQAKAHLKAALSELYKCEDNLTAAMRMDA